MKKMTYNNKTYEIPTSLEQIKVSIDVEEIKSYITKKIALISGYCNIN